MKIRSDGCIAALVIKGERQLRAEPSPQADAKSHAGDSRCEPVQKRAQAVIGKVGDRGFGTRGSNELPRKRR